ncbi:helix-turn-helix domain-containing protein [Actinomadura rugatobispora]|uniref:Helix-turn-helix domain-containing protein n=1 Tax=Actinomadura rugatobispora TaxID=1994 RepID=A0ABW1A341_9ACTN|nr:AraC family transcriptional regulator [Actinomadura rugatobispora]
MAGRTAPIHRYGGRDLWRRSLEWNGIAVEHVRWRAADDSEGLTERPEHLLFVTLSGTTGRTTAVVDGERRSETADFPGAATFIPGTRRRWTRYQGGTITYAALRLDPSHLHALGGAGRLGDTRRIEFGAFTNRPDPFLHQLAAALVDGPPGGGAADQLFADSLATTLMLHLVRRYSNLAGPHRAAAPRRPRPLNGTALRAVLDHIHGNLGEDLRMDALAAVAGMDRHHFARAFKAATGTPPHRYVTERRLELAARLLRERADPPHAIADIAYQVGLSSQSHLTTAFRRRYGATPHAYRRAHGDPV